MSLFNRDRRPSADFIAVPAEPSRHQLAVADAIAALDRILAAAAAEPKRNWTLIDRTLDERLAVRPAVPTIPGRTT